MGPDRRLAAPEEGVPMGWKWRVRTAVVVAAVVPATAMVAETVAADAPNVGTPWVVTLGDSAISGEAGRWAGNSNVSPSYVDTGWNAYNDNADGTAETIPGCHRSRAAEAHIGGGVNSLNLACSGARTYTQTGGDFKPGLDWYVGPQGASQVVQLQQFAATSNVKAVTVLIGANNFGFADMTSPSWWKNYCNDDRSIRDRFTAAAVDARTNEVAGALANVAAAMANAGYTPSDWTLIVQTYWSPIPNGSGIRYAESGWSRQSVGGCGVWNRDADWANNTAVASMNRALTDGVARSGVTNSVVLDMSAALNGHRLCERGVGLLEERGLTNWTQPGASDNTEWVSQIRTVTAIFGPYQLQEGIHSSYWGQLAMRNCLRQAFNGGAVRGGRCTNTTGLNDLGEPNMTLT
jgi:hypothetical protein